MVRHCSMVEFMATTNHNRGKDDHDTHGNYDGFPHIRVDVLLLKCNNNSHSLSYFYYSMINMAINLIDLLLQERSSTSVGFIQEAIHCPLRG